MVNENLTDVKKKIIGVCGGWQNLKNVDLAVTWSVPAGTVWSSNAVTEQKREGIGGGGVVGIM